MRVAIDPGHGLPDPGAVWAWMQESDVVLAVARSMARMLESNGHGVMVTRAGRRLTFARRWEYVDGWNPNCYVSLHCNADADADEDGDPIARGYEVWRISSAASDVLALSIARSMEQVADLCGKSRGIKTALADSPGPPRSAYNVLRHATCASVLVELGFIDDPVFNEAVRRMENIDRVALAACEGIEAWGGV